VLQRVARSFGLTGRYDLIIYYILRRNCCLLLFLNSFTTTEFQNIAHRSISLYFIYIPCHQTLPDVTDFDYSVLELACTEPIEANSKAKTTSSTVDYANIWSLSDLSALLTQSAHATQLANNVRQNHVRFALHETVETCSALFQLVQRSAYAEALLHSTNLTYTSNSAHIQEMMPPVRIRLSFPSLHAATEMTCDAAQSLTLLTTWSSSASDAFEGHYVLEAGCTVEQALK